MHIYFDNLIIALSRYNNTIICVNNTFKFTLELKINYIIKTLILINIHSPFLLMFLYKREIFLYINFNINSFHYFK